MHRSFGAMRFDTQTRHVHLLIIHIFDYIYIMTDSVLNSLAHILARLRSRMLRCYCMSHEYFMCLWDDASNIRTVLYFSIKIYSLINQFNFKWFLNNIFEKKSCTETKLTFEQKTNEIRNHSILYESHICLTFKHGCANSYYYRQNTWINNSMAHR